MTYYNIFRKHVLVTSVYLLLAILCSSATQAQNTTAKIAQIGKLQIFIAELEKGYQIVQQGLAFIGDIKNLDFNLHNDHFSSLYKVNSTIKNSDKIGAIISMQEQILSGYPSWSTRFQQSGTFSTDQLSYITSVYTNLLELVLEDIGELTLVITSGSLQMKDDERISRIDKLYKEVQDKYKFFFTFTAGVNLQRLQTSSTLSETQTLNKLLLP